MQTQNILITIGAVLICFGVMRLIYVNYRNIGNVSLARWAVTGGTVELIFGVVTGTANWMRLKPDQNSRICLFIYAGILLIYLAL